jgi:hypothetical protein
MGTKTKNAREKAKSTKKKADDGPPTKKTRLPRGGPKEPEGTPPQLPGKKKRKTTKTVKEPRRSPRKSPAKQAAKEVLVTSAKQAAKEVLVTSAKQAAKEVVGTSAKQAAKEVVVTSAKQAAKEVVVTSASTNHSPNIESDYGTSSSSDDAESQDDAGADDAEEEVGAVSDGEECEANTSDDDDEGEAADIAAPEDNDPEVSLQTDTYSTRHRITTSGEDKYWMVNTRKLVADCAPSTTKKFILYLPLSPINTGSSLMIEDDINLQELALTRGGPEKYSTDRAFCFNQHHRKAKAQLNRSIVLNLSLPSSPYLLATNVMSGKHGPMTLNPALSHLQNIAGLQKLLGSDALYCDDKAHLIWVGLFAAGVVFGMSRAGPQDTLDKIIDIDYEAHARYEMISRLGHQGKNPHLLVC